MNMIDLSYYRTSAYTDIKKQFYDLSLIDLKDWVLAEAIPTFQAIVEVDPEAKIILQHGGFERRQGLLITWSRDLRPEEIQKIERDQRELAAKHAAEDYAKGRKEYERLKAIYEPEAK